MKTSIVQLLCIAIALAATPVIAQTDASLAASIAEHESSMPASVYERSAFLRRATIGSALLATDGAYVAWLEKTERETAVHLLDAETLQSRKLLSLARLRSIEWGADGKLILDLGDVAGVLDPHQPEAASFVARLNPARGDYLLGASGAPSGGVLVVRKPQPNMHVLELADSAGKISELYRTGERIERAMLGSAGQRAFIETVSSDARHILEIRGGSSRTLLSCPIVATCRLLSHDPDSDTLWLLSSHDSDLMGLRALTLADGAIRTVHEDPDGITDIDSVSLFNASPALAVYQDGMRNYALEPLHDTHLKRLAELLPNRHLSFTLAREGGAWLVVARASVLREARYYLYDAALMNLREILTQARDDVLLPEDALSSKLPLQYQARDGQRVHAYVSLPKGRLLRETPLVVLPHGGPWSHVKPDYFSLTQFLVNRGYIVFEPNFRASTGYGRSWMEAAAREFGDSAVQADIVDGVQYLLGQGIGDADKLGIVGGSFGGFSVLAGLAFTPDLFKVGVAAVPPASLGSSIRYQIKHSGIKQRDPAAPELMRQLMVDINDQPDMQRLHDISPKAHLAAIEAPLLIIAGADDNTVDIAHVKEYTLELLNLGKTISLLVDEDAGHTMESPLMWEAFFYASETMLAQYLGGQRQTVEDPFLASYLQRNLLLNANPDFMLD